MSAKKRILFLLSDTGGGHRASMNAIKAGIVERYGEGVFDFDDVDVNKAMGFPHNYMPEFYPWVVANARWLWTMGYQLGDYLLTSRLLGYLTYFTNRGKLHRMVKDHPADVIICVHSIISQPSFTAVKGANHGQMPPFITVVTDLVTTPSFWYDPRVDLCLVPTQPAFDKGIKMGMKPSQMQITGLPVHPNFERRLIGKARARTELDWHDELPAVLIVGGSDGMGPLYETVSAIHALKLPCQIAIVAGKNKDLYKKLKNTDWQQPVHIYPFIDFMPKLMAASDIIVTKAGPSSICEACIAGLPIILYDAIPGQEDGNVQFVIENKIGVFAQKPEKVASTVARWLESGTEKLEELSNRALSLAQPDAVFNIVDALQPYLEDDK